LELFVNELTLSWFSLFLGVVFFLLLLASLPSKTKATWSLFLAFFFLALLYLSVIYQTSTTTFSFWHSVQRKIQLIFPLTSTLFFFRYMVYFPRKIREWKILNILPWLYGGLSLPFALLLVEEAFRRPEEGESFYFFPILVLILFHLFSMFFLAFWKRRFFLKHQEVENAKSTLAFLKPFVFGLVVIFFEILVVFDWMDEFVEAPAISVLLQCFQFSVFFVFFQYSQIRISVISRILALLMFVMLILLGNSGHYMMGVFRKEFQNQIPIQKNSSFRFEPKNSKDYHFSSQEYSFLEENLVCYPTDPFLSQSFALPFSFVFYGKEYSQVQVFRQPVVIFGSKTLRYNYDLPFFYPAIIAYSQYDMESLEHASPVCVSSQEDSIRFTWSDLRNSKAPTEDLVSVQIQLNRDGTIVWNYKEVPAVQKIFGHNWSTTLDLVGIFPGGRHLHRGALHAGAIYKDFQRDYLWFVHSRLVGLLLIILVLYLFLFFLFPLFLKKLLVNPLDQITAMIERISDGDFSQKAKVPFHDEIGFIANAFNFLQQSLKRSIEVQKENLRLVQDQNQMLEENVRKRTEELSKRNQNLEKDLVLARRIQEKILPTFPEDSFLSSFYKPMEEVGGDFFEKIEFRDSSKVGIFIGDVSGHGVSAAFVTSMLKMSLLQSGERKNSPRELMSFLNDSLGSYIHHHFLTAFYGIYSKDTQKLLYSNAGHLAPYLISSTGIQELESGTSPGLGMFPNDQLIAMQTEYQENEIELPPGSKIFLFTDGIVEVESKDDLLDFFPKEEIQKILVQSQDRAPREILLRVYGSLVHHRGKESFRDDLCMLLLDTTRF